MKNTSTPKKMCDHTKIESYLAELIPDETSRRIFIDSISKALAGINPKMMIFFKANESTEYLLNLIRFFAFEENTYICCDHVVENPRVSFRNLPCHRIAIIENVNLIHRSFLKRVTSGDLFFDNEDNLRKDLPELFIATFKKTMLITEPDISSKYRMIVIDTQIPKQLENIAIAGSEFREYIMSLIST